MRTMRNIPSDHIFLVSWAIIKYCDILYDVYQVIL
jgi:hypothetical protein